MRAESAPVRVLGKCPAFEAVVTAARVVVMRAPLPNLRNNDNCNCLEVIKPPCDVYGVVDNRVLNVVL